MSLNKYTIFKAKITHWHCIEVSCQCIRRYNVPFFDKFQEIFLRYNKLINQPATPGISGFRNRKINIECTAQTKFRAITYASMHCFNKSFGNG